MSFTEKSPEQLARELKIANQTIEELMIFRSIVEGANDGITIVQEGLIKYVNQKLADLTGFTIEEAIGAPFTDFIHPSELSIVIERYNLRMAGKSVPPIYETLLKLQDGGTLRVEISTKVITYDGSPADLIIIRDLTERKKTEERLKTSLAFMDAAPDSFFLFDSDLRLIDTNVSGILGFPEGTQKKDIIGIHLTEMVPGIEKTERYKKYLEVLETEIPVIIDEYDVPTRLGTQYFSSRAFKVRDGLGIISTEITGLKKTEAERERVQEQLRLVKREEELYHSMQSHFIKNDLQRLVFLLESSIFQSYSPLQKEENIREAVEICHHVSKTIDIVNKIFSVLQANFETRKTEHSLLQIIEKISSLINIQFNIEKENLDITILVDNYFRDLLYEIFTFIKESNASSIHISRVKSFEDPLFDIIAIRETTTSPLPAEVCNHLLTGIEEEKWESLGHHIGLTFASVITQYYGGKLVIQPQEEKGNDYNIYLPINLISG